jgi:hypothetical protein
MSKAILSKVQNSSCNKVIFNAILIFFFVNSHQFRAIVRPLRLIFLYVSFFAHFCSIIDISEKQN